MGSFLRKLWQKFAIPTDLVVYDVPDIARIGVPAIEKVLGKIPTIGTLEVDQNPGKIVFTFHSTIVSEKSIREKLKEAGIDVVVEVLKYADRA